MFARFQRALGAGILRLAPYLMKALSIAGTAAMFLVGGGILVHGIPVVHHWIEDLAERAGALPYVGGVFEALGPALAGALFGIVAGAIALAAVSLGRRAWLARQSSAA
jgi:predicted DNA repair protein MutK